MLKLIFLGEQLFIRSYLQSPNLSSPPFAKKLAQNPNHEHCVNKNRARLQDHFDTKLLTSSGNKNQVVCKSDVSSITLVEDVFESLEPQREDIRGQDEQEGDDDLFMPLYDSTELLTVQID